MKLPDEWECSVFSSDCEATFQVSSRSLPPEGDSRDQDSGECEGGNSDEGFPNLYSFPFGVCGIEEPSVEFEEEFEESCSFFAEIASGLEREDCSGEAEDEDEDSKRN